MLVDAEPGATGDLADDGLEPGIFDLGGPPAPRTHHVVVMGGLTGDVRVLPAGEVEALDQTKVLQRVDRSKHRCPTDPETSGTALADEIGRREVTRVIGDQRREAPSRFGQSMAGTLERHEQRLWISHAADDSTNRRVSGLSLNSES